MGEEILRVENLKKYFPVRGQKGKFVKAIDGINFTLSSGETLGLVGESGSGKSTTAYNVIGMEEMTGGKIIFKGRDISNEKGDTNCIPGSRNILKPSAYGT